MAENLTSRSTHGQNIVQEATRDGATTDKGWSVIQNGPQDVRGAILAGGLQVDQNGLKDITGIIVGEGLTIGQNGPKDVKGRDTTDEGRSAGQNGLKDIRGTIEELSVGHNDPKYVKRVATTDEGWCPKYCATYGGGAAADGKGGSAEHPSLENQTIVKFLTPPLQRDARLAVVICMYNIQVHYIGSTTHIRQAKIRAHGFDPLTITKIHFHEFDLTPFETPHPNPNAFHKFPNQLMPSFYATYHLRKPLCSLVNCGELYDSSRVIESLYLDLMAKECDELKQWSKGPFNPMDLQEKNKDLDKLHDSLN
ncbi:hypothetical protein CQW23_08585 [Capsicum baccatum]|uniref:Glycosyltransferase N-terminal domain-containing protein n=1 Tax=Capsicum baccatum TaxID=33114 RepID=A0A2G2X9H1_CAPBA|nr:hypothetical protein CQW23_08585 [Capsicum baccatum]